MFAESQAIELFDGKMKIVKNIEELNSFFDKVREFMKTGSFLSSSGNFRITPSLPPEHSFFVDCFDLVDGIEKRGIIRNVKKEGLKQCIKVYSKENAFVTVSANTNLLDEQLNYVPIKEKLKLFGGIEVKQVDVLGLLQCYFVEVGAYNNIRLNGMYFKI